jgi:hypothetical protein
MEYSITSICNDVGIVSTLVRAYPSGMLIGRRTVDPLTNPPIRAMMNEVQSQGMTAQQRMEKQFFIQFISLVNEVQGKQKLPSQFQSHRKSSWMKQVSNPKQKTDALARI